MNTQHEPIHCDNCASLNIVYEPFAHPPPGAEGKCIWKCNDCKAFVVCHDGSRAPLGRMARPETRKLRARAHEAFDPIWKVHFLLTREQAYDWLARHLGISRNECHFSWLTNDQLKSAILHSCTYIAENLHKASKRIEKRRDQKQRSIQRERDAIERRRNGNQSERARRLKGTRR